MNKEKTYCFIDFETTGLRTNPWNCSYDLTPSAIDEPIEIALVLTDDKFNEINRLTMYINCSSKYTNTHEDLQWRQEALVAFTVHNISPSTIQEFGNDYEDAMCKILVFLKENNICKPILVSDNIRFDWWFMQMIFEDVKVEDVFHYSGWDIGLLLEMHGVKKPKKKHRALDDALLLVDLCKQIKERIE